MKTTNFSHVLMAGLLFFANSHEFLRAQEEQALEAFAAKYDFADVVSGQGGRIDPTDPPKVNHLSFSNFRAICQDESLSEHSSTKAQFSFSGWPLDSGIDFSSLQASTAISLMDKSKYYEFSITAEEGYQVEVQRIVFKLGRTATGPKLFAVSSSHDNHSTLLPVAYSGSSAYVSVMDDAIFVWQDESRSLANHEVSVQILSNSPLVFRIYAWAAEDEKGKCSIDNVEIEGQVYAIDSNNDSISSVDTLQTHLPNEYMDYPCDTSIFSMMLGDTIFKQKILYPKPYVDAMVQLYNPNDSLSLHLLSPDIQLFSKNGESVSDKFQCQLYYDEQIEPQNTGIIYTRFVPHQLAYEMAYLDLLLKGQFVGSYENDEKIIFPLCEMPFSLDSICLPEINVIVPSASTTGMVRCYNPSETDSTQSFRVLTEKASMIDSMTIPSLSFQENFDYQIAWKAAWQDYRIEYSSDFSPKLRFYRLIKSVDNHYLVESKTDSIASDKRLFTQDGRIESIHTFALESVEYENDSVLSVCETTNQSSWTLMSLAPFEASEQMSLVSVKRKDGESLGEDYFWKEDSVWYLLDSLIAGDSCAYQLSFAIDAMDPLITNVYDSICLGDSYQANGFDLPVQSISGDFQFVDTLKAVSGADSIVCLYLNVCEIPSMPEEIYGDSIIMQAGDYVYTIKPVPSAAFYLWTICPGSWALHTQQQRIALTIPYPGNGSISVRAVNRCGASAAKTMNISSASELGEISTTSFQVLPYEGGQRFRLLTQGILGDTYIMVYDLAGNQVYREYRDIQMQEESFEISLESYAGGMYLISIVNEGNQSTAKILKE